jgi:hypothetical protein
VFEIHSNKTIGTGWPQHNVDPVCIEIAQLHKSECITRVPIEDKVCNATGYTRRRIGCITSRYDFRGVEISREAAVGLQWRRTISAIGTTAVSATAAVSAATIDTTTVSTTTIDTTAVGATTINATTVGAATIDTTTVGAATISTTAVNATTIGAAAVSTTTIGTTAVNATTIGTAVGAIRIDHSIVIVIQAQQHTD